MGGAGAGGRGPAGGRGAESGAGVRAEPAAAGPGVNLPGVRSHNGAVVLGLLRQAAGRGSGGISRPELAERAGLTPQAVSKITRRLRAEGLVEEAGRLASTGGKPRTELRLAAGAGCAVGAQLDGERLTAVVADLAGRTVAEHAAPLDLGRPVPEGLAAMAEELRTAAGLAPARVLGVGVGIRGPLDHRTGTLHGVTGYPHWSGCPLRTELAGRLGLPVAVDKNTNAAALAVLAEPRPAAYGGGADSFAYLHLGTGLGAALVLGGGLHRGGAAGAGEFGHQVVQLDGPRCKCGKRGCLEALCLAAVARGDTAGAARLLGVGAANLVALLDVDRIVLGGRTVLAAPGLFRDEVAAAVGGVPVGLPAAGARAVAEGAALLALAPLFSRATLE
ncbi:ROK family transcriptional regulator [Actinacidiphila epipremni]|uniref:ROK family protein n=1 Tax=Actinacidiphila epipremni TaxID=2053013 RepID=A0ABX0ZJS6_9ACTN|nr:ROK family transcriptional regulator [Actinacidiphila epipremni]NJP41918.1 ROK family protein [Actinacidiphila epipremni]